MKGRAVVLAGLCLASPAVSGCAYWDATKPIEVSEDIVLPLHKVDAMSSGSLERLVARLKKATGTKVEPSVVKEVFLPVIAVGFPRGKEGRFLVDSGASTSIVDPQRVAEWGLLAEPILPFPCGFCCAWELSMGIGASQWHRARYVKPGEIRLGGLSVPVWAIGLREIGRGCDGLLGVDGGIDRLPMLFDAERGGMRILPKKRIQDRLASLYPGRVLEKVPLKRDLLGSRARVKIRVGEERLSMLLDTGASATLIPKRLAAAWGLPDAGMRTRLHGVLGDLSLPLYRLQGASLGSWRLPSGIVACGEEAILGYDVLSQVPFVLDFPGNSLWLVLPDAQAAGKQPGEHFP